MSKAARPTLTLKPAPAADMTVAAEPEERPEPRNERDDRPVEPVAPTSNPRNDALNRLAASAALETGHDGSIPLDERSPMEAPAEDLPADPVDPYLPASASDDDDGSQGGAPAAAAPASEIVAPVAAPEPKKYTVDARGQKVEVDENAVIEAGLHALRHHGAAELALREANALLAQARGVAQPAAPAPQASAPAPDGDAQRLAEALQFGTKEDAAKAVAALMARGGVSGDVNEVIARQTETRVRDVLDQDKAAKQLEELVPEMLTDARVLALMATEERAARAAGDTRPYTQLYPEIGKKIRGWIDGFKAPATPAAEAAATAPAPAIAARQAAKAAVPTAVVARGAAPAAPAQPRAPTGSEIVAQMRAKRGQRQYI